MTHDTRRFAPWRRLAGLARVGALGVVLLATPGCASMEASSKPRPVASLVSTLFPGSEQPAALPDVVAVINVPFRVGIAFVPDSGNPEFRRSEADRPRLANQGREAFSNYTFISQIETVLSMCLKAGGGQDNICLARSTAGGLRTSTSPYAARLFTPTWMRRRAPPPADAPRAARGLPARRAQAAPRGFFVRPEAARSKRGWPRPAGRSGPTHARRRPRARSPGRHRTSVRPSDRPAGPRNWPPHIGRGVRCHARKPDDRCR